MRTKVVTEIAFDSNASSYASWFTDVSSDVSSIDINRGRSRELDTIEAGECTIILDNEDGRYTPGRTVGETVIPGGTSTTTVVRNESMSSASGSTGAAATGSVNLGDTGPWFWTLTGGTSTNIYGTALDVGSGVNVFTTGLTVGGSVEVKQSTSNAAVPVSAGDSVTASVRGYWQNDTNGGSGTIRCAVEWRDLNGSLLGTTSGTAVSSTSAWVVASVTAAAPPGAATARPVVTGTNTGSVTSAVQLYVDYVNFSATVTTTMPDVTVPGAGGYGPKIKPRRQVRVNTLLDDNMIHFECVRPATADLDKNRFELSAGAFISSPSDGGTLVWGLNLLSSYTSGFAYLGEKNDSSFAYVKAGKQYAASVWVRNFAPGHTIGLQVHGWYKDAVELMAADNGVSYTTLGVVTTGSTSWTLLSLTFTPEEDMAVRLRIGLSKSVAGAVTDARFRDAKLSLVVDEPGYSQSATIPNSGSYPQFRGYIDVWDVETDGFMSEVTVKAADWLSVASRPLNTYGREYIKRQYELYVRNQPTSFAQSTFSYWPLDGAAEDATAQPAYGTYPLVKASSSFSPAVGQFGYEGFDKQHDNGNTVYRVDDDNWAKGQVLKLVDKGYPSIPMSTYDTTMTTFWAYPKRPAAGRSCLFWMADVNGVQILGFYLNSNGTMTAEFRGNAEGAAPLTFTSAFTVVENSPVHVACFIYKYDATTTGVGIHVNDNKANNGEVFASANMERYTPAYVQWGGRIVGNTQADFYHGSLSHVTFSTGPISNYMKTATYEGIDAEYTLKESDVVTAILDYAGYSGYRRIDSGLSTLIPPMWTPDSDAAALAKATAEDGGGTFFVGPAGEAVFHNRARRFQPISRWTISEWAAPMRYSLDAAYLLNQVTATRETGASRTVSNAASVAEFGLKNKDIRRNVASDVELYHAAGWVLHKYRESSPRCDNLTIDVSALNGSGATEEGLVGLALGGAISDRVTLTGLPPTAPDDTLSFFIEGVNVSMKADGAKLNYQVSYSVSDAARSSAFLVGDPTYGVLDSDASVLTY